jgi:DNA-binding transcriptional LysR family regulator
VSEPAFPQNPDGRRAILGLLAVSELKVIQGLASGKTQVEIGSDVHLEQSTISRMLKHAEERVGFAIVELSGRKLQLTAAGQDLASAAERVVHAFDRLDDYVRALRRGEAGTVRFVTSSTPGSYVLPAIVAEFLRERAQVSVDMKIMPISSLWQAFEAEQFDFAIAPVMGLPKYLESEQLYNDPVVFFAAPELPIANKGSMSLDDLAGETLIGKFVDSHWRRIFRELEEAGFSAKRRVTIIPPEGVKRMVAQGLGIGVLFESSVRRELADGVFTRIPLAGISLHESFCIAKSAAKGLLSPAAAHFLAHLRSRFSYEVLE